RMRQVAAGKGVNVARVMRCLGRDVVATGFLGGDNGRFIDEALRAEGVVTRFEWLERGASRNCHTLVDARTSSSTEILERGPELTEGDRQRFLDRLETLLPGVEAVVIAGSIPERSEEHTSELQSRENLVCRLLLEKKNKLTAVQ